MNRSVLARVGLFSELAPEELDGLADCVQRRRYSKGQVIFVQGDPGSSLYVIDSGQVRISRSSTEGKELALAVLGPGDFFGELALLDGEARSADAVAQEECHLLLLPRVEFVRFVETRPRVALQLLAVLSRRLRAADQLTQDAVFLDVPARLARALLDLAESQGKPADKGVVIACRLTQAELAGVIGATRESINKCLGLYVRQGLISYRRGSITVLRPEGLRKRLY